MTFKSFAELTNQVHLLNDLILSDMIYVKGDYAEEFLEFSRHLYATKFWFQRISWANKRRYILALIDDLRSMWALSMLLKALWNCRPKDAVLSISEHHVLTSHDLTPMDHNRTALPVKVLGQIMINDRKWFQSLDAEYQTKALSELLVIAGGPIMWEVLRRGQLLYERHREHQLTNLLECIVVNDQQTEERSSLTEKTPKEVVTLNGEPAGDFISKATIHTQASEHAQKELDTSLAAWNAVLKSIRDNQKLEEIEMTFKDGSKQKIWKVNRPKPEVTETVDFIQQLPSTVGKLIISFLPHANLTEYSKVNRYWAYLIDELKAEWTMRQKLNNDLQKLKDIMVKHDVSIELLSPSSVIMAPGSTAPSASVTTRGRLLQTASVRASERSPGGVSFRHTVVDKLKSRKIKPRPIQKLSDLEERLERRGAADGNLWLWCKNVLKYTKGQRMQSLKSDEGLLRFGDLHFPSPLMRQSFDLPLKTPLVRDPAHSTSGLPSPRRNVSCPADATPKEQCLKRLNMWSRDFSSLYKVFKVASYEYPALH